MLPGVALTGAQVALTGPARYDRAKQRKLCQGPLILQSVSIFVTGLATAFHSHTFTVSHVTGPGLAPGEPTVDMAPNHVLCFFFYLLHEPGDAQFGPSLQMMLLVVSNSLAELESPYDPAFKSTSHPTIAFGLFCS